MAGLISPALRLKVLKWHRWLTLALLFQLGIWLMTALVMTMIARSSLTAYRAPAPDAFDVIEAWPELDALADTAGEGASVIRLEPVGLAAQLSVDDRLLAAETLAPPSRLPPETIAALASKFTGEAITLEQVSLKERNTVEYQKLPVPAWRVEADQAVLFFDEKTGAYITQTTRMGFIDNLATTIHIMDWTGKAIFRKNVVLTFFGLLFLNAAILGILAFRKLYLKKRAIPKAMKIHQIVGLVLAIQVFFWVSSGLGVVWLLHPLREQAEHILKADAPPHRLAGRHRASERYF